MPAVQAPKPVTPNPVEIANWRTGEANARQGYNTQAARLAYMRSQATLENNIAQRQMGFNNRQARQSFDDPYIGRGVFRSGIRRNALSDLLSSQENTLNNQLQRYGSQMGGLDIEDYLAMQARDTTLSNIALQEYARREQLRSDISKVM